MISWNVIVFLVSALVESSYQIQVGDRCVDNYTQTIGKCTPAESCDSARKAYHENGVRPTLCLYSPFGTTLVCCKDGIPAFNVVSQFNNVPRPQDDSPRPQDDSPRPQYDSPRPQDDSPRPQDVSPNPPVITPSVENRFSTIPTDTRRVSEKSDEDEFKPVEPLSGDYYDIDRIEDSIRKTILSIDSERDTRTEELLAQLWALKLKNLSKEQRRFAEKIITDVLFEAESGNLTKKHLKMVSNPVVCEKASLEKIRVKARQLGDKRNIEINSPMMQLQLSFNADKNQEL